METQIERYNVVPMELRQRRQWVLWRFEHKNGKPTKIPYGINGTTASSTDPATWNTFETVCAKLEAEDFRYNGIGYVFSADDPYLGIDLDDSVDVDSGQLKPWAAEIVQRLNTYAEISPSGEGVKLWVKAKLPARGRKATCHDGSVEMYDHGRYFTVTANVCPTKSTAPLTIRESQAEIDSIYRAVFGTSDGVEFEASGEASGDSPTNHRAVSTTGDFTPSTASTASTDTSKPTVPVVPTDTTADDDRIISLLLNESTGKGADLWHGGFSEGERSEKAQALFCKLAFYTKDAEQIRRVSARSPFAAEYEKWNRTDWVNNCISKALEYVTDEYKPTIATVGAGEWYRDEPRPLHTDSQARLERKIYPPTDMGNAEHFADTYGADLRWVNAWRKWIVWDGKRWAVDDRSQAQRKAMRFIRGDMLEYAKPSGWDSEDQRSKYLKWTMASQSTGRLDAMMSQAQHLLAISTSELDADGNLFNVDNGTIDLTTGTIRPHSRTDLLTKISPVTFDPAATAPRWDSFLNRIMQGDDGQTQAELVAYLQAAVGYTMTTNVSEQCLFVTYGSGKNGKTTFIEALLYVMGEYGLVGQQSLLLDDGKNKSNSEDEANLLSIRFAMCSETNQGQRFDEAKIKRLTGNQKIRARRLYESSFEFDATHKLWLDCNHKPKVRNNDEGIWRRIKLIPFIQQIADNERDGHLKDKLRDEASGILNWMMLGLRAWINNGRRLDHPKVVSDAVNEYRDESDDFGMFLSDCVKNTFDTDREPVDAV